MGMAGVMAGGLCLSSSNPSAAPSLRLRAPASCKVRGKGLRNMVLPQRKTFDGLKFVKSLHSTNFVLTSGVSDEFVKGCPGFPLGATTKGFAFTFIIIPD